MSLPASTEPSNTDLGTSLSMRGRSPVRRRMIAVRPYLLVPEGAVLPPFALSAEVIALAEPAPPLAEAERAVPETAPTRTPFDLFLAAILETARAEGCESAAERLPEVLRERVEASAAWRDVLNGASSDLGACGATTLDGFGAEVIGALLGAPKSRAADYRRALRRRGVAAFGLIPA